MASNFSELTTPKADNEFRVFFDTKRPVPIEEIGKFLADFGREFSRSESVYSLELSDIRLSSLDFRFRAIRKPKKSGRNHPNSEISAALGKAKRAELLGLMAMALTAPAAVESTLNLLDRFGGEEVSLQANNLPRKAIPHHVIKKMARLAKEEKAEKRALPREHERRLLEAHLRAGEQLKLAGRIMPRKEATFKTVKGNQFPIETNGCKAPRGSLILVRAEVTSIDGRGIGLEIIDFERIDDR